jgi:O-antigen/teichoic acid export membrane protein
VSSQPTSRAAPRTIVNVITNWAAVVFGMAITFVLSPFLVHHLGDTRYGLWGVIGSVIGYLGLMDMGIRVGVTRFTARHAATGDREATNRLVSTALGMFAVVGVLASVAGLVISLNIDHFLHTTTEYVREGRIALLIAGITMAVSLVSGVYGAVIGGLQRFALLNGIDLTAEVIRAAATFILIARGGGLITLAVIQLVIVTGRGIIYAVATHRLTPWLSVGRAFYDRGTRNEVMSFSAYTFMLHVTAMALFSSDAIVIAAIMPVSQVAYFVIGGNLSQVVMQVQGGVSRVIYPLVSSRQAVDGLGGTALLVRSSVRLSTLIVLPIILTFLTRGPTFIGLWIGPEYVLQAGRVLQVLAIGLCVFMSYHVLSVSIMALGLHKGLVPAYVGEAIANIGLSILLGRTMGVVGVAWGTTIPRIAVALFFAPWFCSRKLGVSVREYATQAWIRPIAAMIPFAVVSLVIDRTWAAPNMIAFFAQVALVMPVAALGTWLVGLEQLERDRLIGWFRIARSRYAWLS